MKSFVLQVTLLTLLTCFSTITIAGGGSGGGGNGMECYNPTGGPYTTQLLEFWEAENKFYPFTEKLKIIRRDEPVDWQIEKALQKLDQLNPKLGEEVRKSYTHIKYNNETRAGVTIEPSDENDVMQPYSVPGCERVGIGQYSNFISLDLLFYDNDRLQNMHPTDQAGFWVHEAVYHTLRTKTGHINSLQTRYIVGYLFSDKNLKPTNEKPGDWVQASAYCEAIDKPSTFSGYADSISLGVYLHVGNGKLSITPEYQSSTQMYVEDELITPMTQFFINPETMFFDVKREFSAEVVRRVQFKNVSVQKKAKTALGLITQEMLNPWFKDSFHAPGYTSYLQLIDYLDTKSQFQRSGSFQLYLNVNGAFRGKLRKDFGFGRFFVETLPGVDQYKEKELNSSDIEKTIPDLYKVTCRPYTYGGEH